MQEKPNNRPLLPPNYVSLRQLRERHLKEEQEKEKEMESVRESNVGGRFPPIYAPHWQPKVRCLQEEEEIEKGKGREKETDHCARLPPNDVSLRQLKEEQENKKGKGGGEESESSPLLPPNYVSLRQLRDQRLREQKERENEKEQEEERVKRKMKEKAKEVEEEEGGNNSLLLLNYVSLRQIKELRLQEKEEKEAGKEAQKPRLQQIKAREKRVESRLIEVQISEKASNRTRNFSSKKPDKLGGTESRWVWQPVFPPSGATTNAGISSANSVFKSENAGASHEVVMAVSHQNIDSEIKRKDENNKNMNGWKKHNKKHSRETTSGKNRSEPLVSPELTMEVTGLKRGGIGTTKVVASSHNENDTLKKGKEGKLNLTKSSGQSIPICEDMKGFNGPRSMRYKGHTSRDKGKWKEVDLSGPSHNVVPVSKVAKGSDVLEEATGSKIKYDKEQKDKGEMVDIPQSSDQDPSHEEAKGVHGAGEVIGSEIASGEEKGRGKNVNLPESSKLGHRIGVNWLKKNQAAWNSGMGQQRVGKFTVRSAEHPRREGGLVWVPKRSS